MNLNDLGFAINYYDFEGDLIEKCILLHCGDTILKFEDVEELRKFSLRITGMLPEIECVVNDGY